MNDKILREAVCAFLIERYGVGPAVKALLQKVDDGPYHSMPVDELSADELAMLDVAARSGLVRRMPANARFPERFVLTGGGSHETGTFDMDTLHDERGEIRRARRDGTLKSKRW